LATQHREISEDSSGGRVTREEIGRAWAARDKTLDPRADKALMWLAGCHGLVHSVNEELDLTDDERKTGEVLASGKPGAVVEFADGEVLVLSWVIGSHYDYPEPEEDLGLIAMGLAAAKGRPFRVGQVWVLDDAPAAACRRSPLYAPESHPALWHRVRSAVSRPKIACPGQWCISCKQRIYCEAWLTRAAAALVILGLEVKAAKEGQIPKLDITSATASDLAERIKTVESLVDFAKPQLQAAVKSGVRCVVNGKEYYSRLADGRETADVKALKAAGLTEYIKVGDPYETFGWRKVPGFAVATSKARSKS